MGTLGARVISGAMEETPSANPSPQQPSTAAAPQQWQPSVPPQKRYRWKSALGAVGAIAAIIVIKVALGFGAKEATTAFNKTYHAPSTIAGVAKVVSPDASLSSHLKELEKDFDLPGLQNAHSESAAYGATSETLSYLLGFGQDNAGSQTQRGNNGLTDQFPDATGAVNQSNSGINVSCGSVDDGTVSYQGCTWYNDDAFGLFIDNVATNPTDAATTLMKVLKAMVA